MGSFQRRNAVRHFCCCPYFLREMIFLLFFPIDLYIRWCVCVCVCVCVSWVCRVCRVCRVCLWRPSGPEGVDQIDIPVTAADSAGECFRVKCFKANPHKGNVVTWTTAIRQWWPTNWQSAGLPKQDLSFKSGHHIDSLNTNNRFIFELRHLRLLLLYIGRMIKLINIVQTGSVWLLFWCY